MRVIIFDVMRTKQKRGKDHDVKHSAAQTISSSKSAVSPRDEALGPPHCTRTRTVTDRGSRGGDGGGALG